MSTNNLKADSASAEEQGESQIAKSITNESEKRARDEVISHMPASAEAMSQEHQSVEKQGRLQMRNHYQDDPAENEQKRGSMLNFGNELSASDKQLFHNVND